MRLIEHAEIEDPDFGVFLRLAATTGARRGELCALRWRDVDLAEGTLMISRALVGCADGGYVEKDTKTHAARRIALDSSMVKTLKAHKQRQAERALVGGVRINGQTRVFSYEPDGSVPWRPDGVTARFVRLRDNLGLAGVRLHDLRHFVATRMLARWCSGPDGLGPSRPRQLVDDVERLRPLPGGVRPRRSRSARSAPRPDPHGPLELMAAETARPPVSTCR